MFKQAKIASMILIVAGIFIASNLYTMLPIQTVLTEKYMISLEAASMASFCFIISYAFGLLSFGILTDRFEEKHILIYGMLALSIMTLWIPFANNYLTFLIGRSIQGFLAASFAPAAFSYIFHHFHGKTQTISIAMINTGFLFAGIFGQMLSAALVFSFSFHSLFYAFSGFYFIFFILLIVTLEYSKKTNIITTKLLRHIVTLIRFTPLQKLYITAFFLLFTVMLFYGGFEILLAKENQSFPFSHQTFRLIGLIGIVPAFFASQLESRFGPIQVLSGSLVLMSIGFIFPIVTLNEWTLIMASICMIGSTSLTIPMVVLLVGRYGHESKGRAISLYSFTLLTGASVGSICAALIPFTYILIGIVFLFIGLVLMSRSLQKEKDQKLKVSSNSI
ncbi:MFS transporter [Salinibacillus xinjiangensis]|uniref:MFS transporter n=1 Tax=Salinibacillus xinjiangensis TaxID=1229268 RepID=A0A6G1X7Q1_9BACI|nr:MFS transporter [Salinibacillus xinjiangensis]MRG87031.1 MFS transporter [Salinibacillus xinjiangensis]